MTPPHTRPFSSPPFHASTLLFFISFAAASHSSPLTPHSVPRSPDSSLLPACLLKDRTLSPPSHCSPFPIPPSSSRWSKYLGAMVPFRRIASDRSLLPVMVEFCSIYTDTLSSAFSSVIPLLLIPFQLSSAPHLLPLYLVPPSRKASLYPVCASIQPLHSTLHLATLRFFPPSVKLP